MAEKQEALSIYVQAAAAEREQFLYQRALEKARPITRSMRDAEKAEYLQSASFQNTLRQIRRKDKVWQALQRGELVMESMQVEFERLLPLLLEERNHQLPVHLPFLRSVAACHASLSQVYSAMDIIQSGAVATLLKEQTASFTDQTEGSVQQWLRKANLCKGISGEDIRPDQIISRVMQTNFPKGIRPGHIHQACMPQSLASRLEQEALKVYPVLGRCGRVCLPSGQKITTLLQREVRQAEYAVCCAVRKRFPAERIRSLLLQNDALREVRRKAEKAYSAQQTLRTALLKAIPPHYRDLYPLARQMHRHFVLHLGPTNSGKTYEGVQRLRGARKGVYLGPLRLLAAEQFETLNMADTPCSLITGEERIIVPGSRVQSSTVEMANLGVHYDVAVIDECQMIADRDRGGAWTAAILGLCADEIHVCASPDAEKLLIRMIQECGDTYTLVRHERKTPLEVEKEGFQFPGSVRAGDALIVFSKARVHAVAAELRAKGFRVSLVYGALPPDVRRDQAERFHQGSTDVVVSTDAIAMGMNLPIERVVFLESEKYDGDITRTLTDAEMKQIAGRAGRYGQYDVGYVNAFGFKALVSHALSKPLPPLTEAVIGFPESLLGLPLPLTQIIAQWQRMQDKDFFSKASTARMAALAAMMETRHTDKELLYRFLCIPFDETEQDLLARWKALYHGEVQGQHTRVEALLPSLLNPEECTAPMLDGLEADYRRCDLYYNYARLFLEGADAVLDLIQQRKDLISQGIIHILSTQKLQARACRNCKKRLPWDWPYPLCDACFRSGHRVFGGQRRR